MIGECNLCHRNGRLLVHHINRVHADDTPGNRISICYRCHNLEHQRGWGPRNEYVFDMPGPSFETIQAEFDKCGPRA